MQGNRNRTVNIRAGRIGKLGLCLPAALFGLAACTEPVPVDPYSTDAGFLTKVPEQVVTLAAPYQSLEAVRINPADGCYWYRHKGPVETTMLPLRTTGGNPICTAAGAKPS